MSARNSQEFQSLAGAVPSTTAVCYGDRSPLISMFDRFASAVTRGVGSPMAFCAALVVVVVWALSGPFFHYSENWQLVINTGTTIVTS